MALCRITINREIQKSSSNEEILEGGVAASCFLLSDALIPKVSICIDW